jgi:hypothetical protein
VPKQGFKAITVYADVYAEIEKAMKEANQKAGYRKYRSVAHFVESAIMAYTET